MKDKRHIKRFNEATENLNISDVTNSTEYINENMKYTLIEKEPNNKQVIVFKSKINKLPEIGIYDIYETVSEIYIPANDDVEQIENIEWWFPIPE